MEISDDESSDNEVVMKEEKDYYNLLGVDKKATASQIKKAYFKKARQYHPDRHHGEEKKYQLLFQEIAEAYEILSNPNKKEIYDKFGVNGLNKRGLIPETKEDLQNMFNFIFDDDEFSDEEDVKDGSEMKPKAKPILKKLELTLEEAFFGCEKSIKFKRSAECKNTKCDNGKIRTNSKCSNCKGVGKVKTSTPSMSKTVTIICDMCQGAKVIQQPCDKCPSQQSNNNRINNNRTSQAVRCTQCQGKKQVSSRCPNLSGHNRRIICQVCNNTRIITSACDACRGKGYVYPQQQQQQRRTSSNSVCMRCKGTKILNFKCSGCKGKGQMTKSEWTTPHWSTGICTKCNGRKVITKTKTCNLCNGKRYINDVSDELKVTVVPGVTNGYVKKYKKIGHEELYKERGDVDIHFVIKPHKVYTRKGKNLFMTKEISLFNAFGGNSDDLLITHEITKKQFRIKVDETDFIQQNEIKCINKLGMPIKKKSSSTNTKQEYGSLYIKFIIKMPTKNSLNSNQIKAIRQSLKSTSTTSSSTTNRSTNNQFNDNDLFDFSDNNCKTYKLQNVSKDQQKKINKLLAQNEYDEKNSKNNSSNKNKNKPNECKQM